MHKISKSDMNFAFRYSTLIKLKLNLHVHELHNYAFYVIWLKSPELVGHGRLSRLNLFHQSISPKYLPKL